MANGTNKKLFLNKIILPLPSLKVVPAQILAKNLFEIFCDTAEYLCSVRRKTKISFKVGKVYVFNFGIIYILETGYNK